MNFFSDPIRLLFRYRLLLRQTARQEISKRYIGSHFGLAWVILHPLLFLTVYAAVYILIFKVRFQLFDSNEYVLLIFCGLVPFLGFSDALGSGVGSVTSNSGLIKNTLFPIELVPIQVLLVSQVIQVSSTGILMTAVFFIKGLSAWVLLYPLLWIFQLMFMAGMLWILSGLNVFFRDLQYIVGTVILLLMMLSPIAYTVDMVPDAMRPFVLFNPIAHFIFCGQHLLMFGKMPPLESVKIVVGSSLSVFFLGYFFFARLKKVLVDNV